MEEIIRDMPRQIRDAWERAGDGAPEIDAERYDAVLIGGMGGSAIAGDILRDCTRRGARAPIRVVRGYDLPAATGPRTLFVASSYSGNTEETLSLFEQAQRAGAGILAVTTGGTLRDLAESGGHPCVGIPAGYPPRGALGYSFVTLLRLLHPFYPDLDIERDVARTADLLDGLTPSYTADGPDSPPRRLAQALVGKIPVVYAPASIESVAVRWKGQFSENAKVLAFAGILPEMNHNEICGWQNNPEALRGMHAIFLRDGGEHPRVRLRMEITRELIAPSAGGVTEVRSSGNSLLERIFSLIYMGDLVSLYLSVFLGTDPIPVEKIDTLKGRLADAP
jgi:glucose/mannose-6-phosphate isomerase